MYCFISSKKLFSLKYISFTYFNQVKTSQFFLQVISFHSRISSLTSESNTVLLLLLLKCRYQVKVCLIMRLSATLLRHWSIFQKCRAEGDEMYLLVSFWKDTVPLLPWRISVVWSTWCEYQDSPNCWHQQSLQGLCQRYRVFFFFLISLLVESLQILLYKTLLITKPGGKEAWWEGAVYSATTHTWEMIRLLMLPLVRSCRPADRIMSTGLIGVFTQKSGYAKSSPSARDESICQLLKCASPAWWECPAVDWSSLELFLPTAGVKVTTV